MSFVSIGNGIIQTRADGGGPDLLVDTVVEYDMEQCWADPCVFTHDC